MGKIKKILTGVLITSGLIALLIYINDISIKREDAQRFQALKEEIQYQRFASHPITHYDTYGSLPTTHEVLIDSIEKAMEYAKMPRYLDIYTDPFGKNKSTYFYLKIDNDSLSEFVVLSAGFDYKIDNDKSVPFDKLKLNDSAQVKSSGRDILISRYLKKDGQWQSALGKDYWLFN